MGPTSSHSTETVSIEEHGARAASMIRDRVVDIANESSDRSEFLRLLAADLRAHFQVAIVAVQASHWSSPMMFVVDDLLSEQIERDAIRQMLASATVMPIACDVPISRSTEGDVVRGLRVELNSIPERACVLLVYRRRPTAAEQIEHLKQLSVYAEATRSVVAQVPIEGSRRSESSEDSSLPSLAGELPGNRNSLRLFHLDLDLGATSYRIANESRRLLGCDRTTILVPKAGRFRVQAVSGVSVIDTRSNSVRAIERLAEAAVVMARPMLLPGEEPLPPQIQTPLDDYLDQSGVMSAVLLPLHAPDHVDQAEGIESAEIDPFNTHGEVIGVIVLEYFSGRVPMSEGPAITLVASEATLSLRNALEHRKVFGLKIWKSIGSLIQSGRMPILASAACLAVALLVGSMIVEVDHYVIATGSVEPTARREVFAAVDGIVKQLHVEDGQRVNEGDLLLELENSELDNRAESLAGEIQTASQRLASIQAVRLSNSVDPSQSSRLALEERQLQSELANLRAQQVIVNAQQRELLVTSPISGTVIGWQLQRRLEERPVARGNLLVSVADHQGPWSLRLHVPDRDVGPVLESAEGDAALPVRFAVATVPEASFAATLHTIGTAARMDESGNHVIDATATVELSDPGHQPDLDRFDPATTPLGADVTARIACGRRSILRSWFGDVFDFVHRNILFYF